MNIQPIQTKYNGYYFRSRLEARWAVFFDQLGIEYEYELEGFRLPSGLAYLPDFYLPTIGAFIEIKPFDHFSYSDLKKMLEFALEGNKQLLLIIGTPGKESMQLINRRSCAPIDEYEAEYGGEINEDEIVAVVLESLRTWGKVSFGSTPFDNAWTLIFKELPPYEEYHLSAASLKAKQARFEFGESG
jgi:hypothetical protein